MICAPPKLVDAVTGHESEVAREVLAVELKIGSEKEALDSVAGEPRQVDLLGHEVWIATSVTSTP